MDSLTHIALGAVTGEALAGRSLGKKAMLIGALAQSLPDIDFVTSFWLPPAQYLLAHRGFSHSLLFAVLAALLLAAVAVRWSRQLTFLKWSIFLGTEILMHLAIDVMNVYGIGLWEPFSHHRYSLNLLFVADPLFTLWPCIALIGLVVSHRQHQGRITFVRLGLIPCGIYMLAAFAMKLSIMHMATEDLRLSANNHRYFTTPAPLNIFLWYIVAEETDGFNTGYRSVFDKGPTNYTFHPRGETLLAPVQKREDVQYLKRFSQQYYVIDYTHDTLAFNDIRFGQAFGWTNPKAPFIFRYDLQQPDNNLLVIQRGRFTGWNASQLKALLLRIRGRRLVYKPAIEYMSIYKTTCLPLPRHDLNAAPNTNP
ncbi:metal-dependent hydrolase [Ohtaekwangia sp.]|uniref:metal-dependent hydrolase n=1 Tax=Ohtaekwangia sp. TaxID=2066019 RepID=UPI002FDCB859